ncbi:hypothetical protein RISK_006345 [Rhodopirellula islandica]|uniref:Uncharacterized protein n=1 Tax=Rhodopirellula islandica TaxID=595434 RepID=A0A0J1E843_RHOIS|nr:hypothetical protein RISK_006345 [Rhodopirellula islandica]
MNAKKPKRSTTRKFKRSGGGDRRVLTPLRLRVSPPLRPISIAIASVLSMR